MSAEVRTLHLQRHCATRLRLVIADNKKVSKEALENVDGVKESSKHRDSFRLSSEPVR